MPMLCVMTLDKALYLQWLSSASIRLELICDGLVSHIGGISDFHPLSATENREKHLHGSEKSLILIYSGSLMICDRIIGYPGSVKGLRGFSSGSIPYTLRPKGDGFNSG